MASKSKTGTGKGNHQKQEKGGLQKEIIVLCTLAFCLLLLLSNFGLCGIVGKALSSVLFGIFGNVAYLAPLAILLLVVYLLYGQKSARTYVKAVAGVVLLVAVCAFLGLALHTYTPSTTLVDYYHFASLRAYAGGLLGGAFLRLFCPLFGVAGTYLLLFLLVIVTLIVLTEKSLLRLVGRGGSQVRKQAERRRQAAREREERLAEERAKTEREAEQKRTRSIPQRKQRGHRREGEIMLDLGQERSRESLQDKSKDELNDKPQDKSKEKKGLPFDTTLSDEYVQKRGKGLYELHVKTLEHPAAGGESEGVSQLAEKEERETLQTTPSGATEGENRPAKQAAMSDQALAEEVQQVQAQAMAQASGAGKPYIAPPFSLLTRGKATGGTSQRQLRETAMKLEKTLLNFGVKVRVTDVSCGPAVTRYELQPEQGVKVSKIVGLADDIKLNLAASDIRIEAPIPGKAAVGIEVPNQENSPVMLRDLLESGEFQKSASRLTFAVGKDISGKALVTDIAKMPHLLVAGATGSGKSVCINTLIMSILYKSSPEDVKLIMVDPKVVELSVYNGIPHLLIPVVTDPRKAAGALNWAVAEMMKRYQLFAEHNVRDLKGFNEKVARGDFSEGEERLEKMPQIVIIVDELADLMMVAPKDVEGAICRLAQLARAAGLHLVLATQRPSVNVITGLIKANMPSRIAFAVSSGVDSRTIIDMNGAEKLLGKGDMLFYPAGYPKPVRVQGSFVSDKEVQGVVSYLTKQYGTVTYSDELEAHMNGAMSTEGASGGELSENGDNDRDQYFLEAGRLIVEKERASIGMLQRMFKIGFNRAARIMDQLAEAGVVGPEEGTKPRKVLMTKQEFEEFAAEETA